MNLNDSLEDTGRYLLDPCFKGREDARDVLRSSPKPEIFCAIGEDHDFFVACFLLISVQMCLYQTPGRRPPRIKSPAVL